ncbi:histidine kinase [Mycobacterium tuberculosis]
MRELDVLTDRDRIARDLHDHVIQRLFAIGLCRVLSCTNVILKRSNDFRTW